MVTVADFNLIRTQYNRLPDWISGYFDGTCTEYRPPTGYKVVACRRWGYTPTPVLVKCELIGPPPHSDVPSWFPPWATHSDAPPPHSDAPPHSDVPPPPTTADITFSSTPKGAKVRVDGVLIGNT